MQKIFKSLFVLFITVLFILPASAQDQPENKDRPARPDIPGKFLFDLGVNQAMNQPDKGFKAGFWGSRTANLAYYLPIRIGESKISLNPGIGISMERFKWANLFILQDTTDNAEVYDLIPNKIYPGLKKSQLVMNYVEFPIEFRFDANPADPSRTFWATVGGRLSVLATAHTKVKYQVDGNSNKIKDQSSFGLSPVRFAATFRFGVAGFGWFVNYNLTPVFQKGMGPSGTDMTVLTAGITINGL